MAFETKNNSGSLFKNDKKESEQHPDYQGSCLIDGVEFWMSAWLKTAETGRKWMSFSFKPKQVAAPAPVQHSARNAVPPRQQGNRQDEDIPF